MVVPMQHFTRRQALASSLAGSALLLAPSLARAAYPDRPIKLVAPFPAGGTVDVVARAVATQLGRQIGGTVVVENVPGAGGTIAGARVAKAAADGYTLLFTTPNHTISPALLAKMPYDTEKDFAPVSLVAQIPELLVANASQPFQDFAGFVQYARANPGKLNYSSAGSGTLPHVTMELLLLRLGLQLTHVPYKGAAPAMNDLLGGQVALKMDTIATSSQHVKSGRLRPLAIASQRRSPLMPDVPTVAEAGLAGYEGILWMGVLAPAQTDPAVVQALYRAIAAFTQQPDFRQQLQADGTDVVGSDPPTFTRQIQAELRQWAEVVKKAQIKAE
jgi:tripartite-type tricarboxylate transporter receptor subunit TctC